MFVSNSVGLAVLFSFLNFVSFDKFSYCGRKSSVFHNFSVIHISFLFLFLLFSFYFLFFDDYLHHHHNHIYELHKAYGHFFGPTDTTLNGAQNQSAGNYVVELLLNPSKPMMGKETSFLMQVKSTAGDVLIELPVSFYILKDGKSVYSNANNYTIVSQGHYDFNYTFNEPGKYILFVDIKDIFYTMDTLSVNFEIDVQAPVLDRINGLIITFVTTYYYIYIPVLALIAISYTIRLKRHGGVKKTP